MAEENTETEGKQGTKKAFSGAGKATSIISKIVSVTLLVALYVLSCFKIVTLEVNDLIKVSLACACLCGTIDLNMVIDKFIKK